MDAQRRAAPTARVPRCLGLAAVLLACACGGSSEEEAVCGNGLAESGERCDDGNDVLGDGCDNTCQPSSVTRGKASNAEAIDLFGYDLALSADGTTLAVGAWGEDSAATGVNGDRDSNAAADAGAVYVFVRDGGAWRQEAYLKASNTGASDTFGVSLAISADGATLAVGATGEDSAATGIGGDQASNAASGAGAAYVFARTGATWSQQAYVKASNTSAGDAFGTKVALSADGATLAVTGYQEDSAATGVNGDQASNAAPGAGAVYVFTRTGATWSQQAYVKASNTGEDDAFGMSVALAADGATMAVGASHESSAATGVGGDQSSNATARAGAVYVFARSGATWSQQAYVKASNPSAYDLFGEALTLSPDGLTLAVGAGGEDSAAAGIGGDQTSDGKEGAGATYLFSRTGATWSQQAYVKASNPGTGDAFGTALALSADGSTLAVGAPEEDSAAAGIGGDQASDGKEGAGATYLFSRTGATWRQQAYVKAVSPGANDAFGQAVALSADASTLLVGAWVEANFSGAFYAYR